MKIYIFKRSLDDSYIIAARYGDHSYNTKWVPKL